MSNSLKPHGLQHARPPVLHYLPEFAQILVHWVGDFNPIISTLIPFSFCPQSFPSSGSFPVSQLFASSGQSIRALASASSLPMNIQSWFPLGLTGLISLLSNRFSRDFSSTTVWAHYSQLRHWWEALISSGILPFRGLTVPWFAGLCWRIPWAEEPGGLWSIGFQRVPHNWNG